MRTHRKYGHVRISSLVRAGRDLLLHGRQRGTCCALPRSRAGPLAGPVDASECGGNTPSRRSRSSCCATMCIASGPSPYGTIASIGALEMDQGRVHGTLARGRRRRAVPIPVAVGTGPTRHLATPLLGAPHPGMRRTWNATLITSTLTRSSTAWSRDPAIGPGRAPTVTSGSVVIPPTGASRCRNPHELRPRNGSGGSASRERGETHHSSLRSLARSAIPIAVSHAGRREWRRVPKIDSIQPLEAKVAPPTLGGKINRHAATRIP